MSILIKVNSFPACQRQLLSSADDLKNVNSLDPDQVRQNVGPDLDPNHLTLIVFLKEYFDFEKKDSRTKKKM